MAQLVRVTEQADRIKAVFSTNNKRMQMLVPRNAGDPGRLISIAFTTIAYDSKLVLCTPESLFGGVLETLKLGLTIGGPAQESWLVPFKNGKTGNLEATLIVGYQGYRNLIDRSKAVIDLHPRAVYANDEFDFEFGSNPRVRHVPHWRVGKPEPGDFIAAYAVARLRGGGVQLEVMPKAEIDAHRARSRAGRDGPWVTDYVPMALKTTIRKISKYLPKASFEMARALDLDERADLGVSQNFDLADIDLTPMQAGEEPKQVGATSPGLKQLTEKLGGTPTRTEDTKPPFRAAPPEQAAGAIDKELVERAGRKLGEPGKNIHVNKETGEVVETAPGEKPVWQADPKPAEPNPAPSMALFDDDNPPVPLGHPVDQALLDEIRKQDEEEARKQGEWRGQK